MESVDLPAEASGAQRTGDRPLAVSEVIGRVRFASAKRGSQIPAVPGCQLVKLLVEGGVDRGQVGERLGQLANCSPFSPISSAYGPTWFA